MSVYDMTVNGIRDRCRLWQWANTQLRHLSALHSNHQITAVVYVGHVAQLLAALVRRDSELSEHAPELVSTARSRDVPASSSPAGRPEGAWSCPTPLAAPRPRGTCSTRRNLR